jgi:tetratricopeptide (TPR) repeat protein
MYVAPEPTVENLPNTMPTLEDRMKKLMIVLLSLGLLSFGTPAGAQSVEWQKLTDESLSLFHQGQYDRAIATAKKALELAEQTLDPNHPIVAASLNNLAGMYFARGRYAEAVPLSERALAIMKVALGPNHPEVASSMKNLAELYRKTGRELEAIKLDEQAAAIEAEGQ